MIRKKKVVITSILVLICLTATGIGAMAWRYLPPPIWLRRHPLNRRTCHIGVIFPTSDRREEIIINYAEEDINAYCDKLGYNVRFDFLVEDANGQCQEHLEKIQQFDDMNVNLIIGGFWNSMCIKALDYINENNMILFSPASMDPSLAIQDDNLYRLYAEDSEQSEAISEMLWKWGIRAVVTLQRDDDWRSSIYNALETYFINLGGYIDRVVYDPEASDFGAYLSDADDLAEQAINDYGRDHVAIVLISCDEGVTIVDEVENYPNLFRLIWFGTNGIVQSSELIEEIPEESAHLVIFSPHESPTDSTKFKELFNRYGEVSEIPLDFVGANLYDICWIYARAVLEAATWRTCAIKPLLPDIAKDHFGASGWCQLNEAGDRYPTDYEFYGCGYEGEDVEWIKYGRYDKYTSEAIWYTDVLGFNPPGYTPEGPIRIAVIATSEPGTEYETLVRFAEEEINQYCEDEDLDLEFEFIHVNAEGSPGYHRYWVEYFDKVGMNLIIGGGWSSMAGFSLDYINENDMLLFSSSSTSPLLSIPDDNLFRLTVDDNDQVKVISQMLLDKAKTSVIFIQASDLWFDLLYEEFGDVYTGTVLEHIRYNSGASGEDLEEVLERTEEIYNDAVDDGVDPNTIGVVFASYNPQPLIALTSGYVGIYGLEWFTDYSVYTPEIIDESPDEAAQIKLYNPQHSIPESQKKDELRTRYSEETGEEIDTHVEYFIFNIYDIARIYGLSVIDVETDETEQVKAVLPSIAADYEGVTGYCPLNEYEDRLSVDYYIWGYAYDEYGEVQQYKYGFYDDDTGIIEWFDEPQ